MNSQKLTYQAIFNEDFNIDQSDNSVENEAVLGDPTFATIHKQLQSMIERMNEPKIPKNNFHVDNGTIDVFPIEEANESLKKEPEFLSMFEEKFNGYTQEQKAVNQVILDKLNNIEKNIEHNSLAIKNFNMLHTETITKLVTKLQDVLDAYSSSTQQKKPLNPTSDKPRDWQEALQDLFCSDQSNNNHCYLDKEAAQRAFYRSETYRRNRSNELRSV